jgi:hypothetical protein
MVQQIGLFRLPVFCLLLLVSYLFTIISILQDGDRVIMLLCREHLTSHTSDFLHACLPS